MLITDAWVPLGHPLHLLSPKLAERNSLELLDANAFASNAASISREIINRLLKRRGWATVIGHNDWFQQTAVAQLKKFGAKARSQTVFAYSYAARDIFRYARSRGWRTVLGQIDPGLGEERIVECLDKGYAGGKADWSPAPLSYWRQWREEIDLADVVVTNSCWTRGMLVGEGISADKLRVIPLAYDQPAASTNFNRNYPFKFDHDRPLRVLFLGQINLRKGVGPLFEAIRLVDGEPIEFWFVGPLQVPMPADLAGRRQIRWFGAVERGGTEDFYRDADVFLFPTFSDGFGLTQLEAQAWRLPVITSRFCGDVVKDGVNGVLLSEINAACIATSLRAFVRAPARLRALSTSSGIEKRFSVNSLAEQFLSL